MGDHHVRSKPTRVAMINVQILIVVNRLARPQAAVHSAFRSEMFMIGTSIMIREQAANAMILFRSNLAIKLYRLWGK